MKARLTSFATYQDLVGYIDCLLNGGSETYCYRKGDNGRGASGKVTGQQHTPMVALPSSELKKKWGSTSKAWGKKVLVKTGTREAVAIAADISPPGVCDLNPAMLIAMGYPGDKELNVQGTWEWID